MGISGNISTMSLAEVFQWLQSGRKTGTLHVDGADRVWKDVYFQEGSIVAATSSNPQEMIGQFLVSTRRINEKELVEALNLQASYRKKVDEKQNGPEYDFLLGNILVKKSLITREDLDASLRLTSEEIIYDLFLWKEGQFEFLDDVLPRREMPSLQLDITHIVLEGAQREDEWELIREAFPNEAAVVRPNVDRIVKQLPLEVEQARTLAFVNGQRTLSDIVKLMKAAKFKVFKSLLTLLRAGLVETGDFQHQLLQPTAQQQVRLDPVRELVFSVQSKLEDERLQEAGEDLDRLARLAPTHPELARFRQRIGDLKMTSSAKAEICPDSVPSLVLSVSDLTKKNLSSEEGFVASRINGVWDVKSIVKVSPCGEAMCLKILKKFLDDGVITFHE